MPIAKSAGENTVNSSLYVFICKRSAGEAANSMEAVLRHHPRQNHPRVINRQLAVLVLIVVDQGSEDSKIYTHIRK